THHHRATPAASQSPSGLVQSIEAGMSDLGIVNVTFAPPPQSYAKQDPGSWMYVQVSHVDGADGVRPSWQADMLAASYYTKAPSVGLPPESGYSVFTTPSCVSDIDSNSCDAS